MGRALAAADYGTVLLIDDDPELRAMLQRFLESKGLQVSAAAGGHEGLARMRTGRFDLVILDIVMEKGEGIETVGEIKQQAQAPAIIGMSGFPDYLPLMRRMGADATLAKPFTMDELWRAIGDLPARDESAMQKERDL